MYRDVTPLAGSLPQLLFHRAAVVEALLGKVHLGAKLSLEPVLRSAGGECTNKRQTDEEGVVFSCYYVFALQPGGYFGARPARTALTVSYPPPPWTMVGC